MTADTNPAETRPLLLLVDDIPENLQVLATNLSDEYDLAFATNGQQAIDMAMENPPDLILLDVMMPGMDGYEVCRELRRRPKTATIPVIFVTARADTDDVVRGFDAGGMDYVTKPFRTAELRARINTHVQLKRLKSLLSICSYCGRIRNDTGEWERLDVHIMKHTGTQFSHGICPTCYEKVKID
ncbi:MAG: response regulator [Myxococcota bacterium]|jgi:DNA-binding response OmpR family regulator